MTRGPERLRLDAALDEADEGVVQTNGVAEWVDATERLDVVVEALRLAAESGLGIGGQTGPAMFTAMRRSADNLSQRVTLFREGKSALESSVTTIEQIRRKRDAIDTDPATTPLPDPGSFADDPEWDDEQRLTEQGRHAAAVSAFQEREALREQRAREIAEEYDRRYEEPIAVMKKIHGLPDPEPAPGRGGGGGDAPGGRTPSGRGPGSPATTGAPHPTTHGTGTVVDTGHGGDVDGGDPTTVPPRDPQTGPDPVDGGPFPTLDPVTPTTVGPAGPVGPLGTGGTVGGPGGLPGGLGTAVGVGVGGGALLGGLAKGGALLGGSPRGIGAGLVPGAQQTRPLGGLSRSAVSGTLGRGPAAGVPATGRPAGRGSVGAATSAGRAGSTGAGTRGGARGAGAVASGSRASGRAGVGASGSRGRQRREGEGPDRDLYEDDGSEWLDDEAAPGVLD